MIELRELNEKLVQNNCVTSLHLDLDSDTQKYNLLLTLSEASGDEKLVLYFWDVSCLELAEFGGGLTQLMHLSVSRLTSGLDRKNFSLADLEHQRISFAFASVDDMS